MPNFRCKLIDNKNATIEDVFKAGSREELLNSLSNHGYTVISVQEESTDSNSIGIKSKKISLKSLILFCRQISTLLNAGESLIESLAALSAESEDKKLSAILKEISTDIQKGTMLSTAIEKQGEAFPPMMSKMIAVGEETGDLGKTMDRLATQYEKQKKIRAKVKGAATYPIVLVFVALAAAVFMLIVIVPKFEEVFSSLGSDLPAITKAMLAISAFITGQWYLAIGGLAAAILLLKRLFANQKVAAWIDHKKLTLKIIKSSSQKIFAASFARTMFTLISSGISIVQALEYTKSNINNVYAQKCIDEIIVGVKKGEGLSQQLSKYPIFPSMLVSMISSGEKSGKIEDMLKKTADYYDEEMDAAISQLMSLLEPIMILLVGVLIGTIVLALYAPMFGMISAMQTGL